jgi:hypothetical protein
MKDLDSLITIYKKTSSRYEKLFILYKIDRCLLYYSNKALDLEFEYYNNFLDNELSILVKNKKKIFKIRFKIVYLIYDINYINISLPENVSEKLDFWALLKMNSKGKTLKYMGLSISNFKIVNYLFPTAILWSSAKPLEKNIFELAELLYEEKPGYKNFVELLEISRKINM